MKILVTGDRTWSDEECIRNALKKYTRKGDVLIEGECHTKINADILARNIAKNELGLEVRSYPANWTEHGKAAGPIRNGLMLKDNPNIELVLAFHSNLDNSKGTKDMCEKAKKLLITTILFTGIEEKVIFGKPPIRE